MCGLVGSQEQDMMLLRTWKSEAITMAKTVGARIRALRKKKNLTLDQLADQAGLSKSSLWELENKDPPRPSGEKLAGIAKTLEVTVDYLLGGDIVEKLET